MNDAEQKLNKGTAIWEMTQTEGWQIIRSQIANEIDIETTDLLDCPIDEVIQHRETIKAFKKVLEMVETAEKEKIEAANALQAEGKK